MKRKASIRALLLSFCYLASFSISSAQSTPDDDVAESTSEAETVPYIEEWEFPTRCYVEKSKVTELITRMNHTVQVFNRKDEFIQCRDKIKVIEVDTDDIKMCSDERILKIQKDLTEVAGELFKLAIGISNPSWEEYIRLDMKKFHLIYDLKALQIFYGPSPCDTSSIAIYPFDPLIEYVEYNLNQLLTLFYYPRPVRSSPPTTPATTTSTTPTTTTSTTSTTTTTTPKPTIDDMLLPDKSFQDLTAMARSNPRAMTNALQQIVSQRYAGRTLLFDSFLSFIQGLPTAENQIIGFGALYDSNQRHNALPTVPQLVKLAGHVKRLNGSASTSSSFVGSAAWSKLADLVHELGPLILTGEKADCQVTNVAYQRQLHVYDPSSWPESAYVYQNLSQTKDLRIYPRIKSNSRIFYIEEEYPLYASDTNPNTQNTIYAAKSFERFVLEDYKNVTVTKQLNREMEWKIVPAKDRQGQFRILSAKYEDFMFVHKSATGNAGYRRVLLSRKAHPNHDMIPDADLWTLKCRPGYYDLPSD